MPDARNSFCHDISIIKASKLCTNNAKNTLKIKNYEGGLKFNISMRKDTLLNWMIYFKR